jgi:hypothetical protein
MKYVTRYAGSVFFFLNTRICVVNSGKNRVFVRSVSRTVPFQRGPFAGSIKQKYAEMKDQKKEQNNTYRMRFCNWGLDFMFSMIYL